MELGEMGSISPIFVLGSASSGKVSKWCLGKMGPTSHPFLRLSMQP